MEFDGPKARLICDPTTAGVFIKKNLMKAVKFGKIIENSRNELEK